MRHTEGLENCASNVFARRRSTDAFDDTTEYGIAGIRIFEMNPGCSRHGTAVERRGEIGISQIFSDVGPWVVFRHPARVCEEVPQGDRRCVARHVRKFGEGWIVARRKAVE